MTKSNGPRICVAVGQWADRPQEEALHTGSIADQLGYPELWIGEAGGFDVFSLATAIGLATGSIALTLGPLPVPVRDPATIATGVASVASLVRRTVDVALGAAPPWVLDRHGKHGAASSTQLGATAAALPALLRGEHDGSALRPRMAAPRVAITVAALGPVAISAAAEHADRMVAGPVDVAAARRLRGELDAAAQRLDRAAPKLAVWLPAAVDPEPETLAQLLGHFASRLADPGYPRLFADAGYRQAADAARRGVPARDLLAKLPIEAIETFGLVGGPATVSSRIAAYARAGVDEIVVVPGTAGDPGGARTLGALAAR